MCCLFGFVDYRHGLTQRQREQLTSALATSSTARGTDATGIAYNGQKLSIYKRPVPGDRLRFHLPREAYTVMGHTRMTTQGSQRRNWNNHPFPGVAGGIHFALAHNGVLHNDWELRKQYRLPKTMVETDSFVAVQMLERLGELTFDSAALVAEALRGTFTITILDEADNLWLVKGNNPLCLYRFPRSGVYVYASTQAILDMAIWDFPFLMEEPEEIHLAPGDILRIDRTGNQDLGHFDPKHIQPKPRQNPWYCSPWESGWETSSYTDDLRSIAGAFGYTPEDVDALLDDGISPEEIEDFFYCG